MKQQVSRVSRVSQAHNRPLQNNPSFLLQFGAFACDRVTLVTFVTLDNARPKPPTRRRSETTAASQSRGGHAERRSRPEPGSRVTNIFEPKNIGFRPRARASLLLFAPTLETVTRY